MSIVSVIENDNKMDEFSVPQSAADSFIQMAENNPQITDNEKEALKDWRKSLKSVEKKDFTKNF
jgi:hypothetical protein